MSQRVSFGNTLSNYMFFFTVFLVVIVSWVLIDLWGRWFNNFTFNTLNLNSKSSYDTFIIAFAATLIIAAFIIYLKSFNIPFYQDITETYTPEHSDNYEDYLFSGIDPLVKIDRIQFLETF